MGLARRLKPFPAGIISDKTVGSPFNKTGQKQTFMKKIATAFFLLTIWFSTTYGQNDLRFGFQASPAITWMRTDSLKTVEGNGANTAFKLGAIGEKYFRPNYAIVSGINFFFNSGGTLRFANGGNRFPNSGNDLDTIAAGSNVHYQLQYVEIPLGLKMKGGSGEDSYLNFFAEVPILTFGFRTKALADVRETNVEGNIREDTRVLSASWGLGGGVEFNISGNTALIGGIYYQQGFLDATRNDDVRSTLRAITLRIGVLF